MDIEATGSCSESVSTKVTIHKMELLLVLQKENFYKQSSSMCIERLTSYILDKFSEYEKSKNNINKLKKVLKVFVCKLLQKWKKSKWSTERFEKSNSAWLSNDLVLPDLSVKSDTITSKVCQNKGRPKTSFEGSSQRTRRRITKQLVNKSSPEVLCSAAQTSLTKSGKRTAAQVINLALTTSPRRFKRMKVIHDTPSCSSLTAYSPEEAMALIIDTDLGKEDYIHIQRSAKSRGANIYPPYNSIAKVKKQCYPSNISITETEVHIPAQDILNHTIERLAYVQQDVLLLHHDHASNIPIEVIYKWGLDGSGGHSIYKQCFANNSMYADTNIILCTIVPLQMFEVNAKGKRVLWQNAFPSSSRYSRIIRLQIEKETKEAVKLHYKAITEEILRLSPTELTLGDKCYTFKHNPVCTMMDGKTCNVLTDTASSQACNVCKATPKELNNIDLLLKKPYPTTSFKFGISVLHSYLRCYEYLLHIAYRLEIRQWQARGKEAKDKVKDRKSIITTKFYHEMGLVVDQPKQGGGNSNDGNTARKFFADPTKSASCTGLDPNIIQRFSNILSVLSCGFSVHIKIFRAYCMDTAKACIEKYGWYKMSASVHKLLIHGADIINSLPLPVGLFSEDVLEVSQKEYKSLRLFHARKTSRVDTNTDIVHWMLIASDPIIASKRKPHKNKRTPFSNDITNMLDPDIIPSLRASDDQDDKLESDDDDD